MTVRANVARMPLRAQRKFVPIREGEGERRGGRDGETNRLSIFTEMDPLWLIKQVETFEQRGAREARNIYTNGLFNVSHRCYQGPLHLRPRTKTPVFGKRLSI